MVAGLRKDAARATPPGRYVFLDGLRGVAALAVVILHATAIVSPEAPILENVGLAVDFFFCLSGFVVAQAYDARLAGRMTVGEFMTKRLIRLYPMILLGVVLGFGAHLYAIGESAGETLALAAREGLVIPSSIDAVAFTLNLPMWSLLFELAACLGYALAVKWLPARALPWLAAASGVALAAGVAVAGQITTFGVGGGAGLLGGLPRVAYPFLIGVLLQRSGLVARLPEFNPLIGILALLAVLLAPPVSAAYHIVTALIVLPAILLIGAATQVRGRAWEITGRLSYPIYLVHWPVLLVVEKLSPLPPTATEALGVLLSVTVAAIALVAYDEPVREWLNGLHRRRVVRA